MAATWCSSRAVLLSNELSADVVSVALRNARLGLVLKMEAPASDDLTTPLHRARTHALHNVHVCVFIHNERPARRLHVPVL